MDINLETRQYHSRGYHYHDHIQVLFPLRGAMKISVDAGSGVIAGGSVAVIPTGCYHDFVPSADCSLLVVDLKLHESDAEQAPVLLTRGSPLVSRMEPWLWRIFRQIGIEVNADGHRAQDAAMLALTGLHLIRPASAPKTKSKASNRIERLAADLGTGGGKTNISAMAREAGISQSHFHALFRATFGSSPRQYDIERRLDVAMECLIATNNTIAEIAYAAGYENVSAFNRIFKRRLGISPGEFRLTGRVD